MYLSGGAIEAKKEEQHFRFDVYNVVACLAPLSLCVSTLCLPLHLSLSLSRSVPHRAGIDFLSLERRESLHAALCARARNNRRHVIFSP